MERIIVTGANGMLASNIIGELLKNGYEVIGTVRSLNRYHGPKGENLELAECDFKDASAMEKLMDGCSGIVHVAAMTSQGENDYEKFRKVNVTATENLVKAAINHGLKRFLYVSTANAIGYGEAEGKPMMYPFTASHYAVSKAEAEKAILPYRDKIDIVIVNPTFMAGRYGSSKGSNRLFNMVRKSQGPQRGELSDNRPELQLQGTVFRCCQGPRQASASRYCPEFSSEGRRRTGRHAPQDGGVYGPFQKQCHNADDQQSLQCHQGRKGTRVQGCPYRFQGNAFLRLWRMTTIENNNKLTAIKMKRTFIAVALCLFSVSLAYAQDKEKDAAPEYEFTVVKENPISSIKDQHRSGTCWCFSALSFLESEIMRTKGYENIDLSEMFVVSKSYHDRAVKYVRLDGHLNFAAGSSFGDVLHVIRDYGIVPQEVMPGLNYGTEKPEHFEMDAALKGYVDAIVQNPNKTLTTAWLDGLDGILKAYLGEAPEEFTVDGVTYTAESYRDWLGINPDDYVSITSFTHHPFWSSFPIEVCDNWRWDYSWNVPLDDMMRIMYNAIENGYTIAWGSDVSEKGFTRNGLGTVPDVDPAPAGGSDQEKWIGKDTSGQETEASAAEEKVITQDMRQDGYDRKTTTDDHGMQIYGIAKDQNGTMYFMVKNSWGDAGKYKGIWYVSDAFVRYKTINFVVHKDALPKDIRKKLGIK